jgi:hypothetical protein
MEVELTPEALPVENSRREGPIYEDISPTEQLLDLMALKRAR